LIRTGPTNFVTLKTKPQGATTISPRRIVAHFLSLQSLDCLATFHLELLQAIIFIAV